jgi:hypothetical protein
VTSLTIHKDNNPVNVFDRHFTINCPMCGIASNVSAVSIPRYEYMVRFRPQQVGIVYRCDSCNSPVFLRFTVNNYDLRNSTIVLDDKYEVVTCYSAACYNAFAAMCRRCIQSTLTELGAEGKDKVLSQLKYLQRTAALDDELFEMLKQIIISGHDGAHPYLPKLSEERAGVLLELMKDVLYQLFVRQAKIQEAMDLRRQAITDAKAKAG